MSLREIRARLRVVEILKLYLKESWHAFTADMPIFDEAYVTKNHTIRLNGYVMLKDKYSPVKVKIELSEIYDWWEWRNTKFQPARYKYLTEHKKMKFSTRMDDLTEYELKQILKVTKWK
jgi:hypothetical protein